MASKRRPEISILNVLFCLLVIFIHIVSYPVSELAPGTLEYTTLKYTAVMIPWRLVSFVVQGFVLLAGVKLFLTKKDEMPYGKYLLSRLKGIILPYVIAYAIYYVFYFAVYDYPLDAMFILKHFVHGSLVCHMYFIPIILQFDLLFPLWKRVVNKCSPIIVIPFALLISAIFESYFPTMLSIAFPNVNFIYNDRIFTTYLAYWLIGCYIGKYYDSFTELLKKNFKTVCTIFGIVLVLCTYFSYIAFNGIAYVPFMNPLHSLYVICTVIFLYAVALKIPEGAYAKIPLLSKIDRASYDIYLWHMMILFFANSIIGKLCITAQGLSFAIRAVVVYVITIALCLLWLALKKKFFKKA